MEYRNLKLTGVLCSVIVSVIFIELNYPLFEGEIPQPTDLAGGLKECLKKSKSLK
jgi:hypothetical protein